MILLTPSYAAAKGHSALSAASPQAETGIEVMVYGATFAPGEPMMWARRIAGSGERLVDLGRRAVRADTREPLASGSHIRFFLGAPVEVADVVLVPVRWDIASHSLSGEFRLSPISSNGTQISLRAICEDLGARSDGIALEQAAKALVEGIASTLGPSLADGHGEPGATAPLVRKGLVGK